jgi:hypothetical protein
MLGRSREEEAELAGIDAAMSLDGISGFPGCWCTDQS